MRNKTINLVIFVLGIAATVLLLLNAFKIGDADVSGMTIAFGGEANLKAGPITITAGKYAINPIFVLAILLPAISGIIAMIMDKKLGAFITLITFVFAIVFILITKEVKVIVELLGKSEHMIEITLGTFAITSLVLSGLGALLSAFKLTISK